ncbi:MAG TPA: tRNA (adenosine(37)-N6)-dimethylallyltransferase MiaA [Sphingobacteriaceae bacterium]|nr:tRNA (adenosine(37)-N6)-dimethylallyltransferase MiaA [Sphingobacteriaceae bacterium]
MNTPGKTLVVIVGPTAVGKTALAIQIAKHFHTEIISADSRQFYKETNTGTAKPSDNELAEVKHHFINSHSVTDTFTVGDFEDQSMKLLDDLFHHHPVIILTGGSGLFINAVCKGFDDLPKTHPEMREKLNREYQENGIEYLQQELKKIDPEYYKKVDHANPQRIIRALEVYRSTGIPFSDYRSGSNKIRPFRIVKIGLNIARDQLYQQINQRVDRMISNGLINEVTALLPFRHLNALNTVGYSEVFDYLDKTCTLDEAIDKIKQHTRNFAKRQLTWFKKDPEITWFEPDQYPEILNFVKERI